MYLFNHLISENALEAGELNWGAQDLPDDVFLEEVTEENNQNTGMCVFSPVY
jgi:hypothetical protein